MKIAVDTYHTLPINAFIAENAVIHLVTICTILNIPEIVAMLCIFDKATQFARSCKKPNNHQQNQFKKQATKDVYLLIFPAW